MCFQISFCYDMLCCHQCQRGRLLETIDNCVLSLMLHKCHIRHQSFTKLSHSENTKDSLYRALSVNKGNAEDSVHRDHSVNEGKAEDSVNRTHSVIEGKMKKVSVNRAHSVIEGKLMKSIFTELTRSSQGTQCLPSSLGD